MKKWISRVGLFVIGCLIVFILLMPSPPEGVTDKTPRNLTSPVNSVKEGIPIAIARAHEWRKELYLYYINVGFYGKEQVQDRKGVISYYFYGKQVKMGLDTLARVDIDMNKNCILQFSAVYGNPKELMGGEPLRTDKWIIDIKEIFSIAKAQVGEKAIFQYNKPKIVLRCTENAWDYAIYSNFQAPGEAILIVLNPTNGKKINSFN